MAQPTIRTSDETLSDLRAVAEKQGDDFVVRIDRRITSTQLPDRIAMLSGAKLVHFMQPELWVPELCGGGEMNLIGFHASDQTRSIGGAVSFRVKQIDPRNVDADAPLRAEWRGPEKLEYPPKSQQGANGQNGTPLAYGISPPSGPASVEQRHQSLSWGRQPGGGSGVQRENYDVNEWRQGAAALESERRSLEKERLENEKSKHRDEIDNLKRSHSAEMSSMKTELMAEIRSIKTETARPVGPDPVLTVLTKIIEQGAEDRRAQAAQAAEDRRAADTRSQKQDERFTQVLDKLADRKERDPLEMVSKVAELIGSKKDNSLIEAQTKMIHTMTDMTSQQIGVAMDFVSAAADLQLGQQRGSEEPGWLKGLDRLFKGIGKVAGARGGVGQLIPQQAPPQGQPQGLPQASGQPNGQPGPGSQATPVNQVPPNQQHIDQIGQKAQKPRPPQAETTMTIVQQLKVAVHAKMDVNLIVHGLINNINDPDLLKFVDESNSDFDLALEKLFGDWSKQAPSNAQYLQALSKAIEAKLVEAGLIGGEEQEEDDGDEPEDEPEEEDGQVVQGDEGGDE